MNKEIIENHKKYLERKSLYRSLGYDIDKERGFILKAAKPLRGAILDAGTGKGHFALALARAGYRFVTFDISKEEQRVAKMNLSYFGLEKMADFKVENGERTSFFDISFDVIFSVNVLHHLKKPYKFIDEMVRILSPGGKIILADFTAEGFKVMDKIHSLEGGRHEVGKVGLAEAEAYLAKKGFKARKAKSKYQCVLVLTRGSK